MTRRIIGMIAILLAMGIGQSSMAVTLEEYGVEITSSGLVDTTNGLRWLDSDLTLGTTATIDSFLANGWRIATGHEIDYLFRRDGPSPDGSDNPLLISDFLVLASALGIPVNGSGNPATTPWACSPIYGDGAFCQSTSNFAFTPYLLTAQSAFPGPGAPGVDLAFQIYLTDVPMFGDFESGVCDECVGRALLVRNVPLPAGLWLLLSALGAQRMFRMTATRLMT